MQCRHVELDLELYQIKYGCVMVIDKRQATSTMPLRFFSQFIDVFFLIIAADICIELFYVFLIIVAHICITISVEAGARQFHQYKSVICRGGCAAICIK